MVGRSDVIILWVDGSCGSETLVPGMSKRSCGACSGFDGCGIDNEGVEKDVRLQQEGKPLRGASQEEPLRIPPHILQRRQDFVRELCCRCFLGMRLRVLDSVHLHRAFRAMCCFFLPRPRLLFLCFHNKILHVFPAFRQTPVQQDWKPHGHHFQSGRSSAQLARPSRSLYVHFMKKRNESFAPGRDRDGSLDRDRWQSRAGSLRL